MAKLCSSYGSSPNSSFLDWFAIDDIYTNDIGAIKSDPGELFEELNICNWPSIHSDIQKIESDSAAIFCGLDMDGEELDMKPEIRNVDCMWSGSTALLSTSASSSFSDSVTSTAVPLSAVTGTGTSTSTSTIQSANIKKELQEGDQPTVVVANNSKFLQLQQQQMRTGAAAEQSNSKSQTKAGPHDDFEQKLQQHSIPNSRPVQSHARQAQSMQHIPPGTSLLRKSNSLQQKKSLQQQMKYGGGGNSSTSIQIPKMYTAEFLRERDQLFTAGGGGGGGSKSVSASSPASGVSATATTTPAYGRPDTPHSLDDDATEFKHSIDLAACMMGSNNISLANDPARFINHLSQELQDTTKSQIDVRLHPGNHSLTEVLDVIVKDNPCVLLSATSSPSLSKILHMRGSDCDSDDGSISGFASSLLDCDYATELSHDSSSINSTHSTPHHHQRHQQQPYLHSDHSYTRCKDGIDDLGPNLETPSDSDEEIDVVSIGDKKLPTNPSDKDRRALQTKVAYKFSNARIVKTANGLRTIPPRRRISYELPYTPASSSPVKSVANSRYPSPASTPYQNQYTGKYMQQQLIAMQSEGGASLPLNVVGDKSRKRVNGVVVSAGAVASASSSSSVEYALPPNKKHRGKKVKALNSPGGGGGGGGGGAPCALKRHYSLDEAADTIEKRNLHNDMERQRRIGLKNLFEALKKQIPSIKDKERAPKVNILREAAKLCEMLVYEDQKLIDQKLMLKEQLRKRQEIVAQLRAQQKE